MRLAGVGDVSLAAEPTQAPARGGAASGDFGAQLKSALADLENSAVSADATTEGLVTGEVDIHEAMVAMEKADVALRVAGTVRTKIIDAYQQLLQAGGG